MASCGSGRLPLGAEDEHQDYARVVRAVVEFVKGAVLHEEVALLGCGRMYLAVFSRIGDIHFALEHHGEIDSVGPVHRTAVLALCHAPAGAEVDLGHQGPEIRRARLLGGNDLEIDADRVLWPEDPKPLVFTEDLLGRKGKLRNLVEPPNVRDPIGGFGIEDVGHLHDDTGLALGADDSSHLHLGVSREKMTGYV